MPRGSRSATRSRTERPGLWWIPIVLIVLSIVLITLCVPANGGGGVAAAANAGASGPSPSSICFGRLSTPFKGVEGIISMTEERSCKKRAAARARERARGEYRQQNQRHPHSPAQLAKLPTRSPPSAPQSWAPPPGGIAPRPSTKGSNDGIAVTHGRHELVRPLRPGRVRDQHYRNRAPHQRRAQLGFCHGAGLACARIVKGRLRRHHDDGVRARRFDGLPSDMVISSGEGGTYPMASLSGRSATSRSTRPSSTPHLRSSPFSTF